MVILPVLSVPSLLLSVTLNEDVIMCSKTVHVSIVTLSCLRESVFGANKSDVFDDGMVAEFGDKPRCWAELS